ncbi:uncharacterized protein LOC142784985 [Rhipicephalus microplus]|uniref:uncharacterized protein LOC142784985 n=1 Tax=Rhipicephalus microplus TaxID=6941 RepID=UPI003F6BB8C1
MAKFKELAVTIAVAVSLGMGGRWYTPKYPDNLPKVPGNYSLGQPCTTNTQGAGPDGHQIWSIAEVCKLSNYKSTFRYDDNFQAEFAYDMSEKMLFTYDNSASLRFKLFETPGIPANLHYIFAADNIQYEDFANECGEGPYSRLRILKALVRFIT